MIVIKKAYLVKQLGASQIQPLIKLMKKTECNKSYIQNWRHT